MGKPNQILVPGGEGIPCLCPGSARRHPVWRSTAAERRASWNIVISTTAAGARADPAAAATEMLPDGRNYMDTDGFNRGAGDRAFFCAESRTKCAAEPHADQGTSKCPSSSAKSTILPSLDARPIA